jgi:NAD(P)H-flavin reductase
MLLAARTSADHCFTYDYADWSVSGETTVKQTIDREEPNWDGLVGFPHNLITSYTFDFTKLYAILCGPPIMIKSVQKSLMEMGMPIDRLYTTLEMRMTCGVGKCAKCNIGHKYICVDGPVFCMAELSKMPDEY